MENEVCQRPNTGTSMDFFFTYSRRLCQGTWFRTYTSATARLKFHYLRLGKEDNILPFDPAIAVPSFPVVIQHFSSASVPSGATPPPQAIPNLSLTVKHEVEL